MSYHILDKFSNLIFLKIKKKSSKIIYQRNFINRHFLPIFSRGIFLTSIDKSTTNLDSQMYLFFFLYITCFFFSLYCLCLSLHACIRLSIRFKSYRSSSSSFQSLSAFANRREFAAQHKHSKSKVFVIILSKVIRLRISWLEKDFSKDFADYQSVVKFANSCFG